MKYSDVLMGWLKACGYTHCYFVAGGNIMHLLNSARNSLTCIPVVHEVAATIATEYHNSTVLAGAAHSSTGKAFALVTAGPGLTNTLTGLAGAWLESRELLLIGGQVKVEDLATGGLRQLGIQEVDGVALAAPVCKRSLCLREPLSPAAFIAEVSIGWHGRPGPVFLELPLDVQAASVPGAWSDIPSIASKDAYTHPVTDENLVHDIACQVAAADRPLLLLGGGLSRVVTQQLKPLLAALSLPVMTTWNGADRYTSEQPNYMGRPNTWGMRYSNLLLQQSDLVVALGTRLGLQQTGFNWRSFVPLGKVVQIEIDHAELDKPSPLRSQRICADADHFLEALLHHPLGDHSEWISYCLNLRDLLPLSESSNLSPNGFLNPYEVVQALSNLSADGDHIVPCSSGGAFTVMMQAYSLRSNQTMLTNKGLASMGYGLAGAIGVAISDPSRRTILVEGDGGFSQNLQELATVSVNCLNLKIFLFCNEGYASIRMTQKNYFDGAYVGCDTGSGLGFPNWISLVQAYGIDVFQLSEGWEDDPGFKALWHTTTPSVFLVPLHPEQTYYPKISSRMSATGAMVSNPLHRMTPDLPESLVETAMRYLPNSLR